MARSAVPDDEQEAEPFRGVLLRYRGRTGLTQKELAARVGVHLRSIQDWEAGISYPRAERLEAVVAALLEAGGFGVGQERREAEALWASLEREAPAYRAPFDATWFESLLARQVAPPAPGRAGAARRPQHRHDWGEAPDVLDFVGRAREVATLRGWVLDEHCRLVAVLGMGGIGKTSLAARVARVVARGFERIYWRGLRDAPPLSEWLAGVIGFLSDQALVPPASESERLMAVLDLLRTRRCLLVLDNFETLFEPGHGEGRYRDGLAGYGRLLQAVSDATHQSCLVLTSREAPAELAVLASSWVRTVQLGGLDVDAAQVLLAPKGLVGTSEQWTELTAHVGGNGLALKVVGETIRDLFGGDVGAFLEAAGASSVFGGLRRLLAEQVERVSAPEQQVLRVLAIERGPVRLADLLAAVGPRLGRRAVLEALEGLRRRSLVERAELVGATAFTLQSVVLEYVTDRLVEAVAGEIARGRPGLLIEQPLIQALAKDYVRQSQERLIGQPVLRQLEASAGAGGTEQQLAGLLEQWRGRPLDTQGYGPGTVVNLLRLLRGDLRGLDLSRLAIRQAYLADVEAQDASLAGAHLSDTVLAEAFALPRAVALSEDGAYLAAGTSVGEVSLWRVADRMPLLTVQGHDSVVHGVGLSGSGGLLVSGGVDGTIKLWEAPSGRLLARLHGQPGEVMCVALNGDARVIAGGTQQGMVQVWEAPSGWLMASWQGHADAVLGVALSADGQLLASGSNDGSLRLWNAPSGRLLATLQTDGAAVLGVALNEDGRLLASGDRNGTIRLWDLPSGRLLATLAGHTRGVPGLALSTDGGLLVSGSQDSTVRLWQSPSGRPLATLQGHTGEVLSVAVDRAGRLLASSGQDGGIRLWEAPSGRPLATMQGYPRDVLSVALGGHGELLASGRLDGTVQVWDIPAGRLLASMPSHGTGVRAVALSGDGGLLASGGFDGTIRLGQPRPGHLLATWRGHTSGVSSLALSGDGQLLVSGSDDTTVRVWEVPTARLLATVHDHTAGVRAVALSADRQRLASGSQDGTARVWEAPSGRLLATFDDHSGGVYGVALSGDGGLLASADFEGTVRLWDTRRAQLLATMRGHTGGVYGLALNTPGTLLASAGCDTTVRVWEARSGQVVATLRGHAGAVWDVALSADGGLLASGAEDGTVRLWDPHTGALLRTLRHTRRYERLDIAGLSGVTAAQRAALLALGAVEPPCT